MRCLRAVLVVGITAVLVLSCRGVLVLSFFFKKYDDDYNNYNRSASSSSSAAGAGRRYDALLALRLEHDGQVEKQQERGTPEAVMVALHISSKKTSSGQSSSSSSSSSSGGGGGERVGTPTLDSTSIEQLAVQRLAKDDGVEFSGGAREGEQRRVIEAHLIFENTSESTRTKSKVDSLLGGLPIEKSALIEANRASERAIIGPAFDVFSGIYGAAVKARALRWLVVRSFAAWFRNHSFYCCTETKPDMIFFFPLFNVFVSLVFAGFKDA